MADSTLNAPTDDGATLTVIHGARRERTEAQALAPLADPVRQALADLPLDSIWQSPLATLKRMLQPFEDEEA